MKNCSALCFAIFLNFFPENTHLVCVPLNKISRIVLKIFHAIFFYNENERIWNNFKGIWNLRHKICHSQNVFKSLRKKKQWLTRKKPYPVFPHCNDFSFRLQPHSIGMHPRLLSGFANNYPSLCRFPLAISERAQCFWQQ